MKKPYYVRGERDGRVSTSDDFHSLERAKAEADTKYKDYPEVKIFKRTLGAMIPDVHEVWGRTSNYKA